MIDDNRIKKVRAESENNSNPADICEKLKGIAWQLKRNPGDKEIVTDDIRVNTILNDLGILTKSKEVNVNGNVELRFTIKSINPIPSRHFIHDGNDYMYYALLSERKYWYIGLRYEFEPEDDEEDEEEDEEEEEEEDMEDDNETSYIIVDAIIDLDKYPPDDYLDEILKKSKTKVKSGENKKENLTYAKLVELMKGKPEKKFNQELARAIFTGMPENELTISGTYSDSFELFSRIADIIKIYDNELDGGKKVFNNPEQEKIIVF